MNVTGWPYAVPTCGTARDGWTCFFQQPSPCSAAQIEAARVRGGVTILRNTKNVDNHLRRVRTCMYEGVQGAWVQPYVGTSRCRRRSLHYRPSAAPHCWVRAPQALTTRTLSTLTTLRIHPIHPSLAAVTGQIQHETFLRASAATLTPNPPTMARVEALKRRVGWPEHGGEVIAVHVRQRNEKELANFGSGAHRKWDAPTIVRATAALARELGVTDALVLSDDNELVLAVLGELGAPRRARTACPPPSSIILPTARAYTHPLLNTDHQ